MGTSPLHSKLPLKFLKITRTFLTGANPFVLKFEKLIKIAGMIREYFPETETIGCFSRLTDVTLKTDQELADLHCAGYISTIKNNPILIFSHPGDILIK